MVCLAQDWLHNLGGPVQNENVRPLLKKLLRISRWCQRALNQAGGPSEHSALCNCTGHLPMKLALESHRCWGWHLLTYWHLLDPQRATRPVSCAAVEAHSSVGTRTASRLAISCCVLRVSFLPYPRGSVPWEADLYHQHQCPSFSSDF